LQTSQANSVILSSHSNDHDLRNEVKDLAAASAAAKSMFETLSKELEQRGKTLESLYPTHSGLFTDAALSLTALRQQMAEIASAQAAKNANPDQPQTEFDPNDAGSFMERPKFKPKGGIKKLFKQVASVCHPDKTDNKTLNGFFTRALEARDAGDLAEMQEISLDLDMYQAGEDSTRVIPDLVERLLGRHAHLSKQVTLWNLKTNQLRKTPMGQVYAMTEHSERTVQEQGKSLFKTFLLGRIGELENEATTIRQMLMTQGHEPAN
jgi:hypothetical protein